MSDPEDKKHSFICIATLVVLILIPGLSYAQPDEIEQIRNAIAARGARWHADETSMSRLTPEQRKMRLGLDESAIFPDSTSEGSAVIPTVAAAPQVLDWRNVGGMNYVSPVKNQGSCGSCWAFAVTAALESQAMMATSLQYNLSEQILVSCSGAGSCSGGSPSSASTFIKNVGLPIESCFPYTATNNSCSNACGNWQSDTEMVTGWHSTSGTVDAIRNALYAYGPVLATFYVYNDFFSYRSGIYSYTSGAYAGAHAVLVIGYDDAQQCFIVKNSWGTGWGEAGFFQIAYTEVSGTTQFGYSVLAYDGYKGAPPTPDTIPPSVSVSSPASGATVSGTTMVSAAASDNVGVTSVEFYIDSVRQITDTSAPFSFAWNTAAVANGHHTLYVVAYDAAANSTASGQVTVDVNNAKDSTSPAVAITSPSDQSNISKVVKIKVAASDNSQLQRLETYVDNSLIGSVGCTASTCSSSFNWNTNSAARGQHTIRACAYDAASNMSEASITVTK